MGLQSWKKTSNVILSYTEAVIKKLKKYIKLQNFMTSDILNHNIATYEALLKLYDIGYKIHISTW